MPEAFFAVAVTVYAVEQFPIFLGYFISPGNLSDKQYRGECRSGFTAP
jgi:hypothetical protein